MSAPILDEIPLEHADRAHLPAAAHISIHKSLQVEHGGLTGVLLK